MGSFYGTPYRAVHYEVVTAVGDHPDRVVLLGRVVVVVVGERPEENDVDVPTTRETRSWICGLYLWRWILIQPGPSFMGSTTSYYLL
jgi:hypothetical protein